MSRRKASDPGSVTGLALRALMAGGFHVSPGHVQWNIAGRCSEPRGVEVASSSMDLIARNKLTWVELKVRCRKCPNCARFRSAMWRDRARTEIALWPVSYLGTLTLTPDEQYRSLLIAQQSLAEQAVRIDELSEAEIFRERCSVIGEWFTLYMKRVRKALGTPMRYLLVAEAHRSGLPHLHVLLHECERYSQDAWDTFSVLKSQWPHGHCTFNGIERDMRASYYVCKYLSKSALARVRASRFYGDVEKLVLHESTQSAIEQRSTEGGARPEQNRGLLSEKKDC